ncbi:hypothetical protein V5799_028998 [Amblyomma americanum]|uniref:Uncharacterized protein n=1 Tax=Amblyomma americanum TaxID=6943 RepID=A0AAQ4ET39_AMBAM
MPFFTVAQDLGWFSSFSARLLCLRGRSFAREQWSSPRVTGQRTGSSRSAVRNHPSGPTPRSLARRR